MPIYVMKLERAASIAMGGSYVPLGALQAPAAGEDGDLSLPCTRTVIWACSDPALDHDLACDALGCLKGSRHGRTAARTHGRAIARTHGRTDARMYHRQQAGTRGRMGVRMYKHTYVMAQPCANMPCCCTVPCYASGDRRR